MIDALDLVLDRSARWDERGPRRAPRLTTDQLRALRHASGGYSYSTDGVASYLRIVRAYQVLEARGFVEVGTLVDYPRAEITEAGLDAMVALDRVRRAFAAFVADPEVVS